MKDQLKLLVELQTIDLDMDQNEQVMKQIRHQIQEHRSILDKLTADLDVQRNSLFETSTLKTQRQDELKEAEERAAKSKDRMMHVSGQKEYNALEKELDQFKRKTDETREQLEHLKDDIERAEKSISEKEEKIRTLQKEISEAEAEAQGRMMSLEGKLGALQTQRATASKIVKQHVIRRYDFIRKRLGGKAIVPVTRESEACSGCCMRLAPQLYIELQRGNNLVTCPTCQRILYFEEHLHEI